ncbi:aspartyl-phosphate phosphatase Spo0E family protein [Bacillus sp. OAE603]|uniref:Spo0E family sporulation regulatory protein-aspartic acid phosphatase n=1 Tax=Gottfriedia sp. OAE603 TaxID=2663872 RepID=UPI00178ACCB0
MATLLQQISKEIEEKRYELVDINKRYGFLHYKTIQCSQELDNLLNQLFKVRYVGCSTNPSYIKVIMGGQ